MLDIYYFFKSIFWGHQDHQYFLKIFLLNYEKRNRSPHTLLNYRLDIEKFLTWLSQMNLNLKDLTPHVIEEYQQYLRGEPTIPRRKLWISFFLKKQIQLTLTSPLGVSSQKRHLSSLKNFFEFLEQMRHELRSHGELFKISPIRSKLHHIKLKGQDIQHTKLLTLENYQQLKTHLKKVEDILIVEILYWGGLRISELCSLTLESFQPHHEILRFVRKGGEWQDLKLENFQAIYHLFLLYLKKKKRDLTLHHESLFLNPWGKGLSARAMSYHIKKLLRRSQIHDPQITAHSFRKACATRLYEKTKDLLLVRNYLNHKDAAVTQTYIST